MVTLANGKSKLAGMSVGLLTDPLKKYLVAVEDELNIVLGR